MHTRLQISSGKSCKKVCAFVLSKHMRIALHTDFNGNEYLRFQQIPTVANSRIAVQHALQSGSLFVNVVPPKHIPSECWKEFPEEYLESPVQDSEYITLFVGSRKKV
jgi:hypothetical protein